MRAEFAEREERGVRGTGEEGSLLNVRIGEFAEQRRQEFAERKKRRVCSRGAEREEKGACGTEGFCGTGGKGSLRNGRRGKIAQREERGV